MEKPDEVQHTSQEAQVEKPPQGEERVYLTEEESKRIRKKTDRNVMPILVWVYFLQIFDKAVFGTAAVFNMQQETGLTGTQFSMVASIAPIAQLAWQPFSSWLIVKVPPRILMPTLVLGWGIAEATIGAGHNFGSLLASRFFLGLFEGSCLPLFSVLTAQWYRRAEQPVRVAAWYCNNGIATIIAGVLAYGLGHIPSEVLEPWQIIFLFAGLLTIVTVPFVYWKLDNTVAAARFLTPLERKQAVERLRANQIGIRTSKFQWSHVLELVLEPKSYLWIALALTLNVGASVTGTFGPLIISGFGFDSFHSSLLNMPFGAVQLIVILAAAWIVEKYRLRSLILFLFTIPVIIGCAMLFALDRAPERLAALLAAYYMVGFLFAGNTLLISWMASNTAGATKSSTTMALYQIGSSVGNIVGPLLFNSDDKPDYHPGLTATLAVFIAFMACILLQFINLYILNKLQSKKRVQNGKPAKLRDLSMTRTYENFDSIEDSQVRLGDHAFEDLTDRQNDEFLYIY
ncbi:major facilitator superfamily domain-containing protein [Xylariaceae sp. FL0662B]|nr:major facilitator superfamily domain-containing protein [Xylariaceae sp. FL0662B]